MVQKKRKLTEADEALALEGGKFRRLWFLSNKKVKTKKIGGKVMGLIYFLLFTIVVGIISFICSINYFRHTEV